MKPDTNPAPTSGASQAGHPPAFPLAAGSGSRFVDPQRVLGEAESWMQDVEMVNEEDRTEDESYALALWDELRRLRNLCREALAMAEAWQDADGAPATDFVCRLRRASGLPNTVVRDGPSAGRSL